LSDRGDVEAGGTAHPNASKHRVNGDRPPFRVICEVRPPVRADLRQVDRQVAALGPVADAFLVPENPIGVPTVSSLVVSKEVSLLGSWPIACLNARDRNLLGFQRDLLTAVACETHELLFVGGDPIPGASGSGLTVRSMMDETRLFADAKGLGPITLGVTSRLGRLPAWKRAADRLFVQASFSLDALLSWRDQTEFAGAVYAGVIVPPSAARARKWSAELEGIDVPDDLTAALDNDPLAGVVFACELIEQIEASGAFDGVHLIAGVRYREMASELDRRRRAARVGSPGR
jgi:methylenetetrahydrofolate reductase (NADPH)